MPDSSASRISALDGLRGIAAMIVLLFHALLVSPTLADTLRQTVPVSGWTRLWTQTPLRLLWSGEEAVLVFFVLSGFVLTLPFLHRPLDPATYYPRRLVRIYLPVWISVAMALLWFWVVPRVSAETFSWWVNAHDTPVTARRMVADLTLLGGTTWLNSPLWSLKWEMWFSFLLPVYLLVLVRWRRAAALKAGVLLAAVPLAGVSPVLDPLKYLPVFGLGVLLAAHLDDIRRAADRWGRHAGRLLAVVALLLLNAHWWPGAHILASLTVPLGAAALVLVFVVWEPARRLGETAVVQFLGRISFSLYLVHEPVVLSIALLLGTIDPGIVLAVGVPASIGLAVVFHRLVETPSLQLSRRVGRWSGQTWKGIRVHRARVDPQT